MNRIMKRYALAAVLAAGLLAACNGGDIKVESKIDGAVEIFPDYAGVTVPPNIAPLDFSLLGEEELDAALLIEGVQGTVRVNARNNEFVILQGKWRKMLESNIGAELKLTVCVKQDGKWAAYEPFEIEVAEEPVDKYLAYRLIPPGYEAANEMGIYQRNLENFSQSAIFENRLTEMNCVNCHSFCMQNPDKMLLHMRIFDAGTYVISDGEIEKLNTKTDSTISALVYPSWHPSGDYVAFSVNNTLQSFHNRNANRIEVYDESSDVVVYDVRNHTIISSPLLKTAANFETFPTFSPDGKTLYFSSAVAVDSLPNNYEQVKYSLCSIGFDASTCSFGEKVDTVYSALTGGGSVSFPRVSPDGRHLIFTLAGYGNFSIWHKDADLYRYDIASKTIERLDALNSNDVDSYHSWSSNSRWLVLSSRREDGLYTRPYIAYIDADGKASKPFMLPQKHPAEYYRRLIYSFNIPEFIKDKVTTGGRKLADKAKNDPGIQLEYRSTK